MTEKDFRNKLNNVIRECLIEKVKEKKLEEDTKRQKVENIIREEIIKLYEAKKITLSESDSAEMKRKQVMNMLKNPKYNHATLAYDLYHPKDQSEKDTVRSLFSKKATGKPDADGAVRHFDDAEITKLYELLRSK